MGVMHYKSGMADDGKGVLCKRTPSWHQATDSARHVTCKRCLAAIERAEQPKRLIVTRAAARKDLLSQAAAFLNDWRVGSYEGSRIDESSPETGDAWSMLNQERQRLAARLHKESGMPGDISAWDPDL